MKKSYDELVIENKKLTKILRHLFAERTGVYFIAGQDGSVDDIGLPDIIHICPSYGVGWTTIYQKSDKHIMSEGS